MCCRIQKNKKINYKENQAHNSKWHRSTRLYRKKKERNIHNCNLLEGEKREAMQQFVLG